MIAIMSGILTYYGWQRPWEIENSEGRRRTDDLCAAFWKFAEDSKSRRVRQDHGRDSYGLTTDDSSTRILDFDEIGAGIIVTEQDEAKFGFTNVAAYLGLTLGALNGRHVIARISPGRFQIRADPDRLKISPEVYFTPAGANTCVGPPGFEKTYCKIGQGKECCIFLAASPRGFECNKFTGSLAEHLVGRMAEGTLNAGRIGNCRNLGWLPEPEKEEK